MPDTMRANLYTQSRLDVSETFLPQHNEEAARILKLFDDVFEVESVATKINHGVPVSTFIEFVRVNLSSRWASLVSDFVNSGCVVVSPSIMKLDSNEDVSYDIDEIAEMEMRQCVDILIPLHTERHSHAQQHIVRSNVTGKQNNFSVRFLTFESARYIFLIFLSLRDV